MQFLPLDERARMLFYLQAFARLFFFWVPLTTVGALAATFFAPAFWVALAAIAWLFGLFMLALWYPTLAFERWGYVLRDEDLVIQRGVIWRSVVTIPTHRIQHVDTRQGPIEQWIGLARLQIYTASGMGADGIIPGLDAAVADALRDDLVKATEGDDGV